MNISKNTKVAVFLVGYFLSDALAQDVQLDWVAQYGPGMAPSAGYSTDMARDMDENIYITGFRTDPETGRDFVTNKYDSSGTLLWSSRYTPIGKGDDIALSVKVDNNNQVYVVGYGEVGEGNIDIITIKYTLDGSESWVKTYDGGASADDKVIASELDHQGNLYVTGHSMNSAGNWDCITIKYEPDGTESWVAIFAGDNDSNDKPESMAIDPEGNVFITVGYWSEGGREMFVIKYASDGTQVWVTANEDPNITWLEDTYIAVDVSGNSFVTAQSSRNDSDAVAIVKYDQAGSQSWVSSYVGIGVYSAIDVGDNGEAFASGRISIASSDFDFLTVKIDTLGSLVWASIYNNEARNRDDEAVAQSITETGGILVTGRSVNDNADICTIKYNSDGSEDWVTVFEGPDGGYDQVVDILQGHEGNVYVYGTLSRAQTGSDYVLIKYDNSGRTQWSQRYNELGFSLVLTMDMELDQEGNVYCTGGGYIGVESGNFTTVKFNSFGEHLWAQEYDGPGENLDLAFSSTMSPQGDIHITGISTGATGIYEFATVKYASDGTENWVNTYVDPGNQYAGATDVVLDLAGNTYVTGTVSGASGDGEIFTIKYGPDGAQVWTASYAGPAGGYDTPVKALVDAMGNILVTGKSEGSSGEDDIVTIKYDPTGAQLWVSRYGGVSRDYPNDMILALNGDLYLAGVSDYDCVTIKYSSSGDELWVKKYVGTDGSSRANTLALDPLGDVVVAGGSRGNNGDYGFLTIKYAPTGEELWTQTREMNDYWIDDIEIDAHADIYVVSGVLLAKYSSLGEELWVFDDLSQLSNIATMIVNDAGEIYLGGTVATGDYYLENSVMSVVKYTQPNYGVSVNDLAIPIEFAIHQNYPNPFNPSTTISYELPEQSTVKLTVFDIRGQEVITLQDISKPPGNYEVQWNGMDQSGNQVSTGVYFARLQAGEFSQTIKMVYLR